MHPELPFLNAGLRASREPAYFLNTSSGCGMNIKHLILPSEGVHSRMCDSVQTSSALPDKVIPALKSPSQGFEAFYSAFNSGENHDQENFIRLNNGRNTGDAAQRFGLQYRGGRR